MPTFNDHTYASTNAGLAPEEIELTAFSFPVGLTPGDWYLGVVNASSNNAIYIVRAIEYTATVIPLTNGIPYNANLGADRLDYYSFKVSSNAIARRVQAHLGGAGDLDLFLRKGPPLPEATNSHYISNPGVVDELIRLETNSLPVPLSPGIWYLAVTNNETFPVGYEITATEFGVEPPPVSGQITNIVITDTNVCITWISVPGTNYYVVAKTNVLGAAGHPSPRPSPRWTPAPPGASPRPVRGGSSMSSKANPGQPHSRPRTLRRASMAPTSAWVGPPCRAPTTSSRARRPSPIRLDHPDSEHHGDGPDHRGLLSH